MNKLPFLNLGCGNRYYPDWHNIDFVADSKFVQVHNLTEGIPFSNASFELVYHSHILEHFELSAARIFLQECFRVLKPGGIIRVVVPDLQSIAENYLVQLQQCLQHPDAVSLANHRWMTIEMLDQLTRIGTGGEMGKYAAQPELINYSFVRNRVGPALDEWRQPQTAVASAVKQKGGMTLSKKLRGGLRNWLRKKIGITDEGWNEYHYTLAGERHKWMYDQVSLQQELINTGFQAPRRQSGTESYLPNWSQYAMLDVEQGQLRKPDSLIMEAIK